MGCRNGKLNLEFYRKCSPMSLLSLLLLSLTSISVAGSDTTATAIRAITLFIISNPRVHAKLRSEIDEAESQGQISSPVTDTEAKSLPYLQACIKEDLRIWPPFTG